MKAVFADTVYYPALLNKDDSFHVEALRLTANLSSQIITTAWVLTEVADALCRPADRKAAAEFIWSLWNHSGVEIIPASEDLFERGLELFAARTDKGWSLTECISFVVMGEGELDEALTSDHHFVQAGFRRLLSRS